jgi:predicted nucleotidyltransferase/transcriptional regulator with XRE-family HTH domain
MKIDSKKLRALMTSQGYTNAKLAKIAGLSRQALQTILNKDRAEVRGRTLQGLARALKLPDENVLGEDPLAGYKALVTEEHAHMDFCGLGLPAAEPRLLDDLFVPVRARRVAEPDHDEGCELTPPGKDGETPEPRVVAEKDSGEGTVAECLFRYRRLLLRGEPGSGKTTSLRHLARSYAKGTQGKDDYPDRPLAPLFVRLAEYTKALERGGEISLVRFVLACVRPGTSPDSSAPWERLLEEQLHRGTCLVLLDGLDEVGRDGSLPAVLRDFVTLYPDNRFVLTSRAVGLDAGPWHRLGFQTCAITRWQEEDIRRFALRWYTSRLGEGGERRRKENERRAEELSAAILSHPPLREIATNPLLLTILANLHYANASLPRRRVDLYAKVVEVLLESWEAGKRAPRPGDPLLGIVLEPREFQWLLSRMALEMQRQDRILSPRWWVTEFVQQFLRDNLALEGDEAKDQSDRVIRHLCERSGLLVERGADLFGFSHRTFQEYFAARGVVDEGGGGGGDPVSLLRPYLYHPHWEEVVRLVSAQLTPAWATALLRTSLDDPDPAGRFLKRGLRLALRCLADGAAVSERRFLDELFSGGDLLGKSRWPGVTLDIIDALLGLKATRHATEADRLLKQIESSARKALAGDEYLEIHELIHGSPRPPQGANHTPGEVCRKCVGGHPFLFVWLAPRLRRETPEEWYAAVFRLLHDKATELVVKLSFINGALRYEADSNEQVRGVLEKFLTRDRSAEVRAACAWALRRAAASHPSTAERLLKRLEQDKSEDVRQGCAAALEQVAPVRTEVSNRLKALLSSPSAKVRQGAVWGLARVAPVDRQLLESFMALARSDREAPQVRIACLHVLDDNLGQDSAVSACVTECLEQDTAPLVQQVAAQVVAEALAEDRWPWSQPLVAKVEAILMAVSDPCPHTLLALDQLMNAKEVRGGVRLERLLGDALAPFGDRITLAFVFGSVARQQQGHDSDIDLLLVGEVRLKEITAALHAAEQVLGRVINPALYTPASFREKHQAGDPFLLEVVRNNKLFLRGGLDELRELVAERLS